MIHRSTVHVCHLTSLQGKSGRQGIFRTYALVLCSSYLILLSDIYVWTGNEYLRVKILKRHPSNDQTADARPGNK